MIFLLNMVIKNFISQYFEVFVLSAVIKATVLEIEP